MANSKQEPALAGGVYAALATPRRPNSIESDSAALLDYLDAVAATGVDGLVLFGSTGEFVHFELEERQKATLLAIKRSRVPVLVNVSHSTLAGTITLAESAIDAGATGVLALPPYFYSYGEDQIFEFYEQFSRLAGGKVPVYLYNLPAYTNPISAQLAARLFQTGAFAGIKDSSGDWNLFQSLQELRQRTPFQLLAGNESLFLRAHRSGADGIVSGVAAAIPELIVALNRALQASQDEQADRLNERLMEFLRFAGRFPAAAAIRQAAAVRGWKLSQCAVPFDEDMAAEAIGFHAWFREWIPAVLAECRQTPAVRT